MPKYPKYRLTLKEAKKYIDNTYSSQIYDSEEEFRAMQTELIEILRKEGNKGGTDEYTEDEWNSWLYGFERYERESYILFNRAIEKISKSFWQDEAWKNPKCHDVCPYGSVCNKEHTIINDETYCYVQIWLGKIIPNFPCDMLQQTTPRAMVVKVWIFAKDKYITLCNFVNDKSLTNG